MNDNPRTVKRMYVRRFGPVGERTLVTNHPEERIAESEERRAATLTRHGVEASAREQANAPRPIELEVDQRTQSALYHRLSVSVQAELVYREPSTEDTFAARRNKPRREDT